MASVTATVKLTKWILGQIDELVAKGIFTSRSEALREAARIMVLSQYGAMGKRKSIFLTKEEKDEALKRFLKKRGFSL
jgi:Arc/MetJ-type ribon-helix-helix transcriptional regulator